MENPGVTFVQKPSKKLRNLLLYGYSELSDLKEDQKISFNEVIIGRLNTIHNSRASDQMSSIFEIKEYTIAGQVSFYYYCVDGLGALYAIIHANKVG